MDPVTLAVDALRTGVGLAILFVLPGLTLGPIVAPGAMSPVVRLARTVAVSMLATAGVSVALVAIGLLRPTILLATMVGLAILPLHARRPGRPRLPRGRARRWWLGAAALGGLALMVLVVPGWLEVLARGAPVAPSWEDLAAAQEMARNGAFPVEVQAWGSGQAFATNHVLPTAHLAAALQLLPPDVLPAVEAYRVALVGAGLLVATMAFGRWVSSLIALLGAVLLLATAWLAEPFRAWDPLAWAVVAALFGLWLADRALVERTRRLILAAALVGAAVLLAHPALFLVWLAMVTGLTAARALVAPGGGPEAAGGLGHRHGRRIGLRRRVSRSMALPMVLGLVVAGGGTLAGLVADGLLTGRPGVAGYLTGRPLDGPGDVPTRLAELPPGWQFSDDPTWDLARAALGVGAPADASPPPGPGRDAIAAALAQPWPRIDGRTPGGLAALLVLLGAGVVAWLVGDPRRQRAILASAVFGAVLAIGALAVLVAADGHAGRDLVVRRLLPAGAMLPVAAALMALWLVGGRLVRTWRAARPDRLNRAAAPGAAAVLVVAAVLLATPWVRATENGAPRPALRPHDPSAVALEAYGWMREQLPDDARILVAAHTPGTVAVLTGRAGIIDGPTYAPEDLSWPAEATARLLGARRLFLDPGGPGAAAFVEREAVDYVLVPGPAAVGGDLGGYEPFPVDLAALAASDRYVLTESFGDGRLLLYRADGR